MASKSRLTHVDVPSHRGRSTVPPVSVSPISSAKNFTNITSASNASASTTRKCAIAQAEDALARIMGQLEQLCQRDDACEVMGQLLRKFDVVTKLSAWTEPRTLH